MKSTNFIKNKLADSKGSMLLMAYYVMIVLMGFGMALVTYSIGEGKSSERTRRSAVALNIAEAGIERALYDLRQDCENDSKTPSWLDGSINGMAIGPNTSDYYDITAYDGNLVNSGSYAVQLKNIAGEEKTVWVKSVGTVGDQTQTILVFAEVYNISPWGNAVFVGSGSGGDAITGNANINGSTHLLATSLSNSDFAIELGGAAFSIGNNYSSLDAAIDSKVPALDTTVVGGETVSTLNTSVWVKNGLIGLSGSGTVGITNATGNAHKELVDGVYNNDGYGGTQGTSNVNSDNGTSSTYPLGDGITFPSLSGAYPSYTSYQDYLFNNSLVISAAADLNELANITPESTFDFDDAINGYGRISMDGTGNLSISGKVYIDGGTLGMAVGTATAINYTGDGIILSEGAVQIDVDLVSKGNNSFPDNILGIMTPGTITFNNSGIDVMGLFYGETSITLSQQMDLIGTLASNYIDMGSNGPSIYQVPETVDDVPAGMIGDSTTCFVKVLSWQKQ